MYVFRFLSILAIGLFCATDVIGQSYQSQPQQSQLNTVQQPIRQMPLQTPPKMVIQNGITVYQQGQAQPNQSAGMADRTMPPGYGSPYPTGLAMPPNGQIKVAANSTPGSVYGLPPQGNQPNGQSIQPQPVAGQPIVGQPVVVAGHQPQPAPVARERVFVGHAEPASRIVPFFLTPPEQQELDEFLVRWEKYSLGIKRYDVDFNMFIYDEAIPGAIPGKPYKTTFGYFKYIAKPLRFVYHVKGEWVGENKIERDDDKTPQLFAEKIIIDEKSVFKYEFNAKTVLQVNVPPELIGKGIADSPLPLIFGAKADDLKRRFSMKIVTGDQYKDKQIWLQAKPLLIEDQQEFSQIEIRLDKATLQAVALKKEDINGKAFTVYTLESPKINDRLASIIVDIKQWFTPAVPKGWKSEINDWILDVQMTQQSQPSVVIPGISPATPQPVIGNQPQPPQRNEIQLYQPK